ncbi:MAG TPA: nucleotide sugar dehydrogenase, partial [Paracoccaceae bacterium]
MKIAVLGLGYVGFTAACCMAQGGHEVIGIDVNERKVREIQSGMSPITEPDVGAMLQAALARGLMLADTEIGGHLQGCDMAVVC